MLLRQRGADVSLVLASPGNYVFGQDFFQNLQEGVILEQKFVGTRLANVRLHPYVIIAGARPALTDPEGDGAVRPRAHLAELRPRLPGLTAAPDTPSQCLSQP